MRSENAILTSVTPGGGWKHVEDHSLRNKDPFSLLLLFFVFLSFPSLSFLPIPILFYLSTSGVKELLLTYTVRLSLCGNALYDEVSYNIISILLYV